MTVALLLALLAGGSPASPSPGVLRVGMEIRAAPWAFVPGVDYTKDDFRKPARAEPAELARLVGFDVDVLHALVRRLGVRARIVPVSWFALEEGLLDRRYDVILSSWTPTLLTPETIVATDPYVDWGLLVVVRADTRLGYLADLPDGARIGHYPDPAVTRALGTAARHLRLLTRDAPELLFQDLKEGRLDAVVYDSVFVRWWLAHDPAFRIVGEPLNRLGYHLGLRREDSDLFDRVQVAVRDLVASGEIGSIRARWESVESPAAR